MRKFLHIIGSIALTISLLTTSILLTSAVTSDFTEDFASYDMQQISGFNHNQLQFIFNDTVDYLYDNRPELNTAIEQELVFQHDEISHMRDVKRLFLIIINVSIVSTMSAFIYTFYLYTTKQSLSKHFIKNDIWITLSTILILLIGIATQFETLFILFHQVLFPQGNWSFNLSDSHLIQLLPESFFMWRAIQITILFITLQILRYSLLYTYMTKDTIDKE